MRATRVDTANTETWAGTRCSLVYQYLAETQQFQNLSNLPCVPTLPTCCLLLHQTRRPGRQNQQLAPPNKKKMHQKSSNRKASLTSVAFAAPSMPLTNLMAPP